MTQDIWLIVGLGNPGQEYAGKRHNAGFSAADSIAEQIRATYWKNECGSLVAHKEWNGKKLFVAKPQSFMNLSGMPVAQLMKKHSVSSEQLIVIHDDLDLPTDSIRIKFGGGHGGHNGIRSIVEKLDTPDFYRIKIGIGRPSGRMPVVDYVLGRPRGEQLEQFEAGTREAADATLYLIENNLEKAQMKFN